MSRISTRISSGKKPVDPEEPDLIVIETGNQFASADIAELQASWSAWSNLESTIRKLDRPLTPEEWSVLEGVATTPAAKNGLAELRQAVSHRGGVGVFSDRKSLKPEIQ